MLVVLLMVPVLFFIAFVVDVRLDLHLLRFQDRSKRWRPRPPGCSTVALAIDLTEELLWRK